MTILSTDLQALKRMGYNGAHVDAGEICFLTIDVLNIVNRILKHQRQAAQAQENDVLLSERLDPPPYQEHDDIDATYTPNDTITTASTSHPKSPFGTSMFNSLRSKMQNRSFSPLRGGLLHNRKENNQAITPLETIGIQI
jgi:hypothetical protein